MNRTYTLSQNTFPIPSPEVLRLAEAVLQQVEDQIPEGGIVEISPDGELICRNIKPPRGRVNRLRSPIRLGRIECVTTLKIMGDCGERRLAQYLSTPSESDRTLREAWDTLRGDWKLASKQGDQQAKDNITEMMHRIRQTKSRNDKLTNTRFA